jgi:hypothetical protein
MSDTAFLFLAVFLFTWGYCTARGMDALGRMDQDRRRREEIKRDYLRNRQVRLDGMKWRDDA